MSKKKLSVLLVRLLSKQKQSTWLKWRQSVWRKNVMSRKMLSASVTKKKKPRDYRPSKSFKHKRRPSVLRKKELSSKIRQLKKRRV